MPEAPDFLDHDLVDDETEESAVHIPASQNPLLQKGKNRDTKATFNLAEAGGKAVVAPEDVARPKAVDASMEADLISDSLRNLATKVESGADPGVLLEMKQDELADTQDALADLTDGGQETLGREYQRRIALLEAEIKWLKEYRPQTGTREAVPSPNREEAQQDSSETIPELDDAFIEPLPDLNEVRDTKEAEIAYREKVAKGIELRAIALLETDVTKIGTEKARQDLEATHKLAVDLGRYERLLEPEDVEEVREYLEEHARALQAQIDRLAAPAS